MPLDLDIVVAETAPVPQPRAGQADGETPAPHDGGEPAGATHRLIARDSGEYLFVGVRGEEGPPAVREPRDLLLQPGDICFYDAHRPPPLYFPPRSRMKAFLVSRASLGLQEDAVHRITNAPVSRASRLGSLVSPFLSELADAAPSSPPPVGQLLAWNAVNLLATLARGQLDGEGPAPQGYRSPLTDRILRFMELHLAEEDLSPETIARAHHISVRYLHRLFQVRGTTVGRWIQRRRLEECRRDLLLRGRENQTIAAVAGRWGFPSATHFSRVFRAAYGMSPSEWRDTALRA
jgi:AraC-like DNA-binding protein